MTADAFKTTLEGERRFATVVFADVSGFTTMSQKTDPEKITAIMNRCFELLEETVMSEGGHVDKYIGDCIMALFGVPKALEHAPAHAVRAALEMRSRLAAFNREHKLSAPLGIHAGISSGLVLAGEVGGARTRDFTVMGDAVNVASRLKDASPEGEIWVGAETYRYIRNDFEYEALRPLNLKGRGGPTSAYRVVGVKVWPSRLVQTTPAEGMIFSSLVGRERELRLLEDRVTKARGGEGAIVSVLGEAGMGKSRLLGEMIELDAARGAQLLRGHGDPLQPGKGADDDRHHPLLLRHDCEHPTPEPHRSRDRRWRLRHVRGCRRALCLFGGVVCDRGSLSPRCRRSGEGGQHPRSGRLPGHEVHPSLPRRRLE